MMKEPTMLQRHQCWIEKYKQSGRSVASYRCPECSNEIETPKPPPGDVYDSAATCPYCDCLYFKVVHSTGVVNTKIMRLPQ